MQIPVDQIAVLDRARRAVDGIPELTESIKKHGQITPVQVRRATQDDVDKHGINLAETPWVLVAGGRRYSAHLYGDIDTIRAEDFGELPPLRQKEIELEENLNRQDLTWDEKVLLTDEIHKLKMQQTGGQWTLANTAQTVKESTANVSRDLKLAQALREDPSLRKQATSKVAAMRILDIREHLEKRERSATSNQWAGQLRALLQTAKAEDFLRAIPTGSVDHVISDFPFGHDHFKTNIRHSYAGKHNQTVGTAEYDDSQAVSLDVFVDVIPQLVRVTKPTSWLAIMMGELNHDYVVDLLESCCTTHFEYGELRYVQDASGDWQRVLPTTCRSAEAGSSCQFMRVESPSWMWFRPNSNNVSNWPERHAKSQYERIIVCNRGEARLLDQSLGNVLVHDAEYGNRKHTHQKPLSLAKDLVSRLSRPGDVVLDPFFGSGALLAGAAALARKPLGCDANPLMLDIALEYVSQYYGGGARTPEASGGHSPSEVVQTGPSGVGS